MKESEVRNNRIIEKRKNGHTLAEIAKSEGISKGRVGQICKPPKETDKGDFDGLSTRTYNSLRRAGVDNIEQLYSVLCSDIYVRNCGEKAWEEIENLCNRKEILEKVKHRYKVKRDGFGGLIFEEL